MTNPFGTSLRRNPDDPRGLRERIDAVVHERIEELVDSTCLEILVASRREAGRSPPVADSAQDRDEFHALVLAFLRHLRAAIDAEAGDRGHRTAASGPGMTAPAMAASSAGAADEPAALIAAQVSLAKRRPDYWQRFETIRTGFAVEYRERRRGRPGVLGQLFGRSSR